jgi:hypothetical protein
MHEEKTALKDNFTFDGINFPELDVKDLGPQVAWKTVFIVEYVRKPNPILLLRKADGSVLCS